MKQLLVYILLICLISFTICVDEDYDFSKYCDKNTSTIVEGSYGYGCKCSNGWDGIHCDICTNDFACADVNNSPDYYCSHNMDVTDGGRVYTCKVTDDDVIGAVGDTTKLSCENNNGDISCVGTIFSTKKDIDMDSSIDYYQPTISCIFTKCEKKKVFNTYSINYSCLKSECLCLGEKCKPYSYLIETTDLGTTAVICNKNTGKCSIESSNDFVPRVFLDCTTGICINNSSGVSQIPDDGSYFDEIKKRLVGAVDGISGFGIFEIILFNITTIIYIVIIARSCFGSLKKQLFNKISSATTHNDIIPETVIDISLDGLSIFVAGRFGKLSKIFRPPKQIIHNIKTNLPGGKLTAIMGKSGAGKSTLLSVLSNRTDGLEISGKITFGGVFDYDQVGKLVYFVPQKDNHLPADLTVRQYLKKTVWMSTKKKDYSEIEHCAESMGIYDQLDCKIGKETDNTLSGGQRRLVSICAALITGKKILVLDEPVSSLDSNTQFIVMSHLHNLAKIQKKTIIISIHGPSDKVLFNFVDNLLFVAGGTINFAENIFQAKNNQVHTPSIYNNEFAILHEMAAYDSFGTHSTDAMIHPGLASVLTSLLDKYSKGMAKSSNAYSVGERLILEYLCERARSSSMIEEDAPQICIDMDEHIQKPKSTIISYGQSDGKIVKKEITLRDFTLPPPQFDQEFEQANELSNSEVELLKNSDENLVSTIRQFMCVLYFELTQWDLYSTAFSHWLFYLIISLINLIFINNVQNDMAGCQTKTGYFIMIFSFITLGTFSTLRSTQLVPHYISFDSRNNPGLANIYNLVRLLTDTIFCRIIPLVFVFSVYPVVGLREGFDHFIIFAIVLLLISLITTISNFIIGLLSPSISQAIWFKILVLLFNLLFSGLIVNENYLPQDARFILSFSPWHAAGNILLVNEFDGALVKVSASGVEYKNLNGRFWLNIIGMGYNDIIHEFLKLFLFLYVLICLFAIVSRRVKK